MTDDYKIDGVPACGQEIDGGRCGRAPEHEGHPHIMEPGTEYEPDPVDLQDQAHGHMTPGDGSDLDYTAERFQEEQMVDRWDVYQPGLQPEDFPKTDQGWQREARTAEAERNLGYGVNYYAPDLDMEAEL
jgi:hypothetical protein